MSYDNETRQNSSFNTEKAQTPGFLKKYPICNLSTNLSKY